MRFFKAVCGAIEIKDFLMLVARPRDTKSVGIAKALHQAHR